jgi:hypothetical protein
MWKMIRGGKESLNIFAERFGTKWRVCSLSLGSQSNENAAHWLGRIVGAATVVAMHNLIVRCTKAGYDLEVRAPETIDQGISK